MIFIALIFLGIIGFMIFVYGGLKFSEDIENEYYNTFFWIAYCLLGFTIINILALGQFWGTLSNKIGPPGPRGPAGDDGKLGITGKCSSDNNVIYTMNIIKKAIQETVNNKYPDLADNKKEIYNPKTLTLNNKYIEHRIKLITTSKQYETLLSIPTETENNTDSNNEIEKRNEDGTLNTKRIKHTYGKTLEDLTGYLSGIWVEWTEGILAEGKKSGIDDKYDTDYGLSFFLSNDAQPDSTPEIEAYFNNEIEKYDVWYWGSTRVFRPLKAEICRNNTSKDSNGNIIPNTRFPVPDKPKIEIKVIEYTDDDMSKFNLLWQDSAIVDADTNMDKWTRGNYGVFGKFMAPSAYIPKIIKEGNKIFYPVGCVFVERRDHHKTGKTKKTILVSGDVIVPRKFQVMWHDFKLSMPMDIIKHKKLAFSDGTFMGRFFKVIADVPGYTSIGDVFLDGREFTNSGINNMNISHGDILNHFGYKNNDISGYFGPVCLPIEYLEEIKYAMTPTWAYREPFKLLTNSIYQVDVFGSVNDDKTYNLLRCDNYMFFNSTGTKKRGLPLYTIKPEYTDVNYNVKIKKLDKQYSDLGFGWFGHPVKSMQKYSIFTYIGLMPEGVIVHRNSGRKYYIKHYGGIEVNRYVIHKWNSKKKNFSQSLKVISSDDVIVANLKNTDIRQQWFIETDPRNRTYFRLIPYKYSNKYLKLNYDINTLGNIHQNTNDVNDKSLSSVRPKGISLDHSTVIAKLTSYKGPVNASNKTLFYNQPAYGVDSNILDNEEAKGVDRSKSMNEQLEELKSLGNNKNFNYIFNDKKINNISNMKHPGNRIDYT